MRETSANTFPGIVPGPSLVARGGALKTFGGLALLLVVALLVLGAYLIEDQFTNPLASQSLGLFAAAVLLASAMAMLYELIQLPRKFSGKQAFAAMRPQATAKVSVPSRKQAVSATKRPKPIPFRIEARRDLAYQRCYVDRVRVRA
jgi:hypothetical protein